MSLIPQAADYPALALMTLPSGTSQEQRWCLLAHPSTLDGSVPSGLGFRKIAGTYSVVTA